MEQSKNWIDDIKDSINSLREEIKKEGFWNFLLKKLGLQRDQEVQETQTETQNKLNNLATAVINIELSKLEDKEINVEGDLDNLNDETTILGLLAKNDENLKNWFLWLKDVDDEDIRSREIEMVLLSLREISNNDSDNSNVDLTEQELKEIGEKAKIKKELCEKTLEAVMNDNTIPDDKKNKTAVIRVYNDVLSENNGDISQVIQEKIITKLKNSSES